MVAIKGLLSEIKTSLLFFDIFIEIYIFGSILHSDLANDIDILILYYNQDDLLHIKNSFISLSFEYPLDIYYMTLEEVKELEFINKTKAINISEL